ncbi:MAG: (Fe-S)-binding protein [Gammaproteobacteria bacterium]|nr:(Fe-S)-binding protein [Gammaproteobacteria bacterium]
MSRPPAEHEHASRVTVDVPVRPVRLRVGASAHVRPHLADAKSRARLGQPPALPEDWQSRALGRMADLLRENRGLRVAMDACMHCGACTDKCHYFLGTGDPNNMPVARQELMRKVYRRHFTLSGRLFPRLVGAEPLSESVLEEWQTYFNQCSQCRRCAHFCPVGIDTAEFSMAARDILASIGLGQRYTAQVLVKALDTGNNLGMPGPALADTLAGLEEDLEEDSGVPVRLPLDQAGSEILLVTPSADFFAEPQVDGLMGYAKVLHQAGLEWTLSSVASEAANFALFDGNRAQMGELLGTIRDQARELGVRRIVFGECGHAWRVAHNYLQSLGGPLDFLPPEHRRAVHIAELTDDLLRAGALRLDPSQNDERRLTFHDSCNIARASMIGRRPGEQFDIPRRLLSASCNHVFEMRADSTRARTFCCGGGGGLLTGELAEIRVKGAAPRMSAFAEVVERHGVTHLVAMCAICKSQFTQILPEFGYEFDRILSLHQVVGDALVLR